MKINKGVALSDGLLDWGVQNKGVTKENKTSTGVHINRTGDTRMNTTYCLNG